LLLIILDDDISSLVFDIEADIALVFDIEADAALVFDMEADDASTLDDDPAANANKLALNPFASTMPVSWLELPMAATLDFDDIAAVACCEAEVAIEAEAVIVEEALTSLLLLASTFIELILCSLDIEDISAFPASIIEVRVPEGAEAG
jgi:hypothetical protein